MSIYVYTGSSMRGSLRMADIVHTDDALFHSIHPGDVIVYKNPSSHKQKIIHRVQSISPDGLITQGDNCYTPDSIPITEQEFIGRVTFVERQRKLKRITGNHAGLLRAKTLRTAKYLRAFLSPVSHPLYTYTGKGVTALLRWHPKIHRIQINTPSGRSIKYIHHEKTVARWDPNTGEWHCKKPFDLILKKPEG